MSYLDDLYTAWEHAESMRARGERDGWSEQTKQEWTRAAAEAKAKLEAEQRRLMEPDAKLRW